MSYSSRRGYGDDRGRVYEGYSSDRSQDGSQDGMVFFPSTEPLDNLNEFSLIYQFSC